MGSSGSVTNPFFSTSRPGFPLCAHQSVWSPVSSLQSSARTLSLISTNRAARPHARSLPSFGLAGSALLCSLNFFFPVLPLPSPLVPLSSLQPKKKFKRCRVRPSAHDLSIISITHARFSPIACKCSIASIRYLVSFVHHTRTYHRHSHTHTHSSRRNYTHCADTHTHIFCLCASIPGHPSIFSCIRGASHRTAATSPSAPACQPACLSVCLHHATTRWHSFIYRSSCRITNKPFHVLAHPPQLLTPRA